MIRARLMKLLLAGLFVFLLLGVFRLQIIYGDKYRQLSDRNCIRLIPQEGRRGRIYDRAQRVLVDTVLSYDVMILPRQASRLSETIERLSVLLGVPSEELKKNYKEEYFASPVAVPVARNIDTGKAIKIEELKLDLPGVIIQAHPLRDYPYGRVASHLVGYLSQIDHWRLTKLSDYGYKTKDIVGFGGIEEKYDYYLRAEEGGQSVEVDRLGRFVRILGFKPPRNGKDIRLTLDLKIQKICEDALSNRKGCVIIMKPYTGEVIAIASVPNFSPSAFIKRRSESYIRSLFRNPDAPLLNRAIGGQYPPGSIFKLIMATGGLESGKLNSSTTFFCAKDIRVGNSEFSCWGTHGQQNLMGAIARSCNVFFYRTGLLLGGQMISDYALKFGLGKATGIDLPYEEEGLVPSPLWKKITKLRSWFDGDTANFSIGQGYLLATPLQMLRMVAVFANGGRLVTPYLVSHVADKDISSYQQRSVDLKIKKSTIEYIRQGMRNVVLNDEGTGHVLASLSVPVAGKTGTAQTGRGSSHAWFTGFFPFKDPQYAICVFLEKGGPGLESCKIAKTIIEEMIKEGLI